MPVTIEAGRDAIVSFFDMEPYKLYRVVRSPDLKAWDNTIVYRDAFGGDRVCEVGANHSIIDANQLTQNMKFERLPEGTRLIVKGN